MAPLDAIVETADRHGAMVMVDDAHGEGVLGHGGRGIVDHFGLQGRVEVEVGTMSKAFGVVGGYVAGPAPVVDWLRQRARPYLFSWANADRFRTEMNNLGFDTGLTQTPITPVILGDEQGAQEFSRRLFDDHGVFAQAIAFPTVPMGKARIRVMISAAHTSEDLEHGLAAFESVGTEMGVIDHE